MTKKEKKMVQTLENLPIKYGIAEYEQYQSRKIKETIYRNSEINFRPRSLRPSRVKILMRGGIVRSV